MSREGVKMSCDKLCLGTVQFGLEYGINNIHGQPLKKDVFHMLDGAIEQGIKCFDTAFAYGNAEELLGDYGINRHKVHVISKLKPNLIAENDINTSKIVEDQIVQSLRRIKIDVLDGYLLHTPTDFYNERIIEALQCCREKGLIKHFGVSIYETKHALDVVASGVVDYIQVPYSLFDQRLDRTEFFKLAKKNNVTVFGRSAFLQGLILMEEDKIPEHLVKAKAYLRQFDDIINKYNFSRVEAAFLFSYTHSGIDYVVFGVDNSGQLKEDIDISQRNLDFAECRGELSKYFQTIEDSIIFPSLWMRK